MSSLLLHSALGLGPGIAQRFPHHVSLRKHTTQRNRYLIKMSKFIHLFRKTRHVALEILSVLPPTTQSRSVLADSTGNDGELDEMFRKELERRRLSGSFDDIQEERSKGSRPSTVIPPPSFNSDETDQLQRSRQLNSEGLEGLIPRGSQLLQLGVSFFLAFGPFIVVVLLAFAAVYSVCGCK